MTLGLYSVALAVARGTASQGSGVNKQFANLVTIPGSIYRTEQICSVSFPALSGNTGNISCLEPLVTAPARPGPRRGGGGAPGGLGGCLGRVHVGLLLRLADVPLVTYPLVAEPVAHL